MADRDLRLRIGAAVDASFTSVMASVVEQTKRARKQIQSEITASARAGAAAERAAAKEGIKAKTEEAKTAKQLADGMSKDVAAAAKKRVADERAATKEVERDLRDHAKERARLHAQNVRLVKDEAKERAKTSGLFGGGRGGGQSGSRGYTRGDAIMMRAGGAALSGAKRLMGSALHGVGLDTTLSGQLTGATHREALATDLAGQGYIGSGKGPEGSKNYIDPKVLMSQANTVGNATGTSSESILEGLDKFTKMTGDLQTARDSMMEIGKIAKANGADFGDMMEAAANVSISMGEVPNKAEHLQTIMRTVAGQGHLGAVTIKDMADQMGKLTAQANFFKIDPRSKATLEAAGVKNETTQNIAIMGAMAQYARAKGGRITAQQATQSSMAFIRDLANPTEVKRMASKGIDVYADAGHTKVRDPLQVMLEVFKGAQVKGGVNRDFVNRVFPNQQSRAVTNALMQDYDKEYQKAAEAGITDETKRHQTAMEALTDTFQNYLKVTQAGTEVQLKFDAAMATTQSQSTILNNQMGKLAEEISRELIPIILQLAPTFLAATKAVLEWVAKISGNEVEDGMIDTKMAEVKGKMATEKTKKLSANSLFGGSADAKKEYDEAEAELTAAVARKEQQIQKDKKATKWGASIQGYDDATIHNFANGMGNSGQPLDDKNKQDLAQRYEKDKDHLASLQKQLAELKTSKEEHLKAFTEALHAKPIVVHLDSPPGATPHTSGKANPNSSSGH